MREAELPRGPDPERLAELQSWYVDRMRPRLVGAAARGAIAPAEAMALDRELRGMLALAPLGDEQPAEEERLADVRR